MSHRFVFICGLHRSGTSLLHRILSEHPDISGFHDTGVPEDEGQHLQTVYPNARQFGGPGKFAFAREAYLNETSPLVTEENRKKLFDEWGGWWDISKPVLLEKSPPNVIRSRFLQAMFPESYFIFIVRHPIAVSLATEKWSHTDLPELMEHWCLAHKGILGDIRQVKRRHLMRYEDFVLNPRAHMKTIYDFIGVSPAPVTQQISNQLNDGYFDVWEEYKETRPEAYKKILELTEMPAQFGYTFDEPYISS